MICLVNVVTVNSYVQLPEGNLNLQYPHLPLEPKPPPTKKSHASAQVLCQCTSRPSPCSDPDMEMSCLLTPINIFWFADWTRFASLLLAMLFFTMPGIDFKIVWIIYSFVFTTTVTCSYLFILVQHCQHMIKSSEPIVAAMVPIPLKNQLWLC